MRIRHLGRDGFWVTTRRWSLSYWPPRAWVPFTIRIGEAGRRGRWGAIRMTKNMGDWPT